MEDKIITLVKAAKDTIEASSVGPNGMERMHLTSQERLLYCRELTETRDQLIAIVKVIDEQ